MGGRTQRKRQVSVPPRSPRAALAALAMSAGVAHAELPTEISSALATAKADGIALGTLVLVVIPPWGFLAPFRGRLAPFGCLLNPCMGYPPASSTAADYCSK